MPEQTTSVVGGGRVPPVCVFVCVQIPLFSNLRFFKYFFMGCKSPAAPGGMVERLILGGRMGRKEGNGGERVIHRCLRHLRKPTVGGLTYSTCCGPLTTASGYSIFKLSRSFSLTFSVRLSLSLY